MAAHPKAGRVAQIRSRRGRSGISSSAIRGQEQDLGGQPAVAGKLRRQLVIV